MTHSTNAYGASYANAPGGFSTSSLGGRALAQSGSSAHQSSSVQKFGRPVALPSSGLPISSVSKNHPHTPTSHHPHQSPSINRNVAPSPQFSLSASPPYEGQRLASSGYLPPPSDYPGRATDPAPDQVLSDPCRSIGYPSESPSRDIQRQPAHPPVVYIPEATDVDLESIDRRTKRKISAPSSPTPKKMKTQQTPSPYYSSSFPARGGYKLNQINRSNEQVEIDTAPQEGVYSADKLDGLGNCGMIHPPRR